MPRPIRMTRSLQATVLTIFFLGRTLLLLDSLLGQEVPWAQNPNNPNNMVGRIMAGTYYADRNSIQTPIGVAPPNSFSQPTPGQTQAFIAANPILSNLDPMTKQSLEMGGQFGVPRTDVLNSQFINGQPNPFYQNGQLVPNWYLPATWSSPTMNWQGVQSNGFLLSTVTNTYNPASSYSTFNSSTYRPIYNPPSPTPSPRSSQPFQPPSQMPWPSRVQISENSSQRSAVAKAVEAVERTLALHEAANDKVGQALGHAELASLYVQNDKLDRAFEHTATAERMANEINDPKLKADVLIRNAAVYVSSGEFDQAILKYRDAILILRSIGDDKGQADVFAAGGWAYESLGKPRDALECYKAALILFHKLHDQDGEIRVHIGRGSIYQSMGEVNLALRDYQTALPAASKEQKAMILASEGEISLSQGHSDYLALKHYQEALQLIEHSSDSTLEGTVLAGIGRSYMMANPFANYYQALGYFKQAEARMKDSRNRQGEAGVIASIGELHYRAAIQYLAGAAPRYVLYPPAFPFASIVCQKCPVDPKLDFASALKAYNDALSLMRGAGDRAGEVGVLTNIGLVFDAQGKYREALEHYRKALDLMDELHDSARIEEFRIDVASQAAGLYTRAILLEVMRGHAEEAFDLSERARARAFLDELGSPRINRRLPQDFVEREESWKRANLSLERRISQELAKPGPDVDQEKIAALEAQRSRVLEQYLQLVSDLKVRDPDYAALLTISPLTLRVAQQQLDPDVTAVSYFTTPNVTLAFVLTRTSFHIRVLRVTEEKLAWTIATLLDFPGDSEVPPSLNLLYKALIAPIKSELTTAKLAIIPHGVLHLVPFAALTKDSKRYLTDDYSVFSLPSLSVLPYVRARRKGVTNQALVFANDQEEGLAHLGRAYDEAREVALQLHTKPILGNDATAAEFQKVAGDYNLIHLIAHIDHDKNHPEISRIILGHGKNEEGALETNQVAELDLRKTGLVVLSGCQSELGRLTQGDDIVGLSRAFIYAGSPSVIASLWSVDDEATRTLMVSFYSHLRQGLGQADALRSAQIDVRREFPHPYYWAGFVLTGDPGTSASPNTIASVGH